MQSTSTVIHSRPILYNTTIGTGRSKQWRTEVFKNEDNTYTIRSQYGTVGGKQVVHDLLITEGKNIGKKNETTPEQQALLESEREWIKKKKQGYSEENASAEETKEQKEPTKSKKSSASSKLLKPMLALEFDMSKTVKFPVYIQPKLDGVRCLVYKDDYGKITFQSRQNTIYDDFPQLSSVLNNLFSHFSDQTGLVLDGELYTHGMPFETITGLVRRSKRNPDEVVKLEYQIYDCFYSGEENLSKNSMPYRERYQVLRSAFDCMQNLNGLRLVDTMEATTKEDIENFHRYFTALEVPYEGIMVRTINGTYKQQGRSKDLQKYKKFMDEEFKVVGHHEGNGTHAGTPIFECKSNVNNEKTFSVTMQGTLESKRTMMENIEDRFYGKMLTVKYQEKSADGIPRFPVGIGFRDYE
jgi:ATP-dependent DNA ligase